MWTYTALWVLCIFAFWCGFLPVEEDFYFKDKFLTSTGLSDYSFSFGGSSLFGGSTRSASKVGVADEEKNAENTGTNPFGKSGDTTNPFTSKSEKEKE